MNGERFVEQFLKGKSCKAIFHPDQQRRLPIETRQDHQHMFARCSSPVSAFDHETAKRDIP